MYGGGLISLCSLDKPFTRLVLSIITSLQSLIWLKLSFIMIMVLF